MATEAAPGPGAARAGSVARVLSRLVRRPELGALVGTVLVWIFFAIVAGQTGFLSRDGTAAFLSAAAELGILAVAVSMLMIAGEFDLSVGSMIGAASMIIAVGTSVYNWSLPLAIVVSFLVALVVGFGNGLVTVYTRLPSFIVTLAALFILRGFTIGWTRYLTGDTRVGGVRGAVGDGWLVQVFAGQIGEFSVSILWWLGLAAIATWVLTRTRFGNWIYGTGGDREAARRSGVRVNQVKIILFMVTACSAVIVALVQVLSTGSGDVLRGQQDEFEAIIAVVIGGTLLTGGYGSAVGACLGALTFGMVSLGIFYAGWNTDWFLAFLGVLLLAAVLANNWFRKKALEAQ
jgi:simple sugar transport system permease protein